MDKAELTSLFEAFGLSELWTHLVPTLRASIKIKLEPQQATPLGDSKIGGMPDFLSLRVPAGRTSSQHRLSDGVFICSGSCAGAGILLSGSGVNVTGSSAGIFFPEGSRPPFRY